MEEDFEAFIAAATGSMIERGGTNVALLGCLPKKDPRRCETVPLARGAFRLMRDDAFSEMQHSRYGLDKFESAYEEVKGRLAREVFADDDELLRRLAAVDALVRKHGVQVLAAADAEAHEGKENVAPLTYNDMHAGTFARALSALAGRKGAEKQAEMFAAYFSGDASPDVVNAVESQLNGIGWLTPEEHRNRILKGMKQFRMDLYERKRKAPAALDLAERGSVGVGATRGAPGSASDDVADPEPSAAPPTPAVSPAGGGARRGKRFTGKKRDPATIKGAAKFIALGVPLICSECDTKETSRWTASKADPNKPVCRACYQRQVRRAFRFLASIVCILSAIPVFVTDAYGICLHSSPPPAATAPTAGSPVRTRPICARRGSRTARGCA